MNIGPISFGKKYIRSANAIDNSTQSVKKMDFVEYEKNGKDLLHLLQTQKLWTEVYGECDTYIDKIVLDMYNIIKSGDDSRQTKVYALEDEDGQIQAVCEIGRYYTTIDSKLKEGKEPATIIRYISTNPKSMHGKKDRKYSKLGTSLFKEILKQIKKEDTKGIVLLDSSGGFWDKLPNMKTENCEYAKINFMESDKFNDSIRRLNAVI